MGRGNRVLVQGGIYHVTDRCHNRDFLLKFARDRSAYVEKIREALKKFKVCILEYCITRNHIHLTVFSEDPEEISRFMHKVAGEMAQEYNRRKDRSGAFWGDNYHAVLIDSGIYLERCIVYIELNMVRCHVVSHPRDWKWVGYHEIMGLKRRNRVVDVERLCELTGAGSLKDFQGHLEELIQQTIAKRNLARDPKWTESVAVGTAGFVAKIEPLVRWRRELETVQEEGNCILREVGPEYRTGSFGP